MATAQKVQHSGRSGPRHSGKIYEHQQCSPLEQSTRGLLQNSSRCPSGSTMREPAQDHRTTISIGGGAIYIIPFADDIDLMGGSSGELQDLTNRLVERATTHEKEVSAGKSNILTTSTNNINAVISMIGQMSEEVTSVKYLGSTLLQGWHLLSRSPHQDCLSNGSNGQTISRLSVQHTQLRKHVQAVHVSCHLHPPPGL